MLTRKTIPVSGLISAKFCCRMRSTWPYPDVSSNCSAHSNYRNVLKTLDLLRLDSVPIVTLVTSFLPYHFRVGEMALMGDIQEDVVFTAEGLVEGRSTGRCAAGQTRLIERFY